MAAFSRRSREWTAVHNRGEEHLSHIINTLLYVFRPRHAVEAKPTPRMTPPPILSEATSIISYGSIGRGAP